MSTPRLLTTLSIEFALSVKNRPSLSVLKTVRTTLPSLGTVSKTTGWTT